MAHEGNNTFDLMDDSLQLDDDRIRKLQEEKDQLSENLAKIEAVQSKKQEFLKLKIEENCSLRKCKDEVVEELDAVRKQLNEMEYKNTGLEMQNSDFLVKVEEVDELKAKLVKIEAEKADIVAEKVRIEAENAEIQAESARILENSKNSKTSDDLMDDHDPNASSVPLPEVTLANVSYLNETNNFDISASQVALPPELECEIRELQNRNVELETMLKKIKDTQLTEEHKSILSKTAELESSHTEQKNIIEELKQQLADVQAEKFDIEADMNEDNNISTFHDELDQKLQKIEDLENKNSLLIEENQKITAKNENLESSSHEQEIENTNLTATNVDLQTTAQELQTNNIELMTVNAEIQTKNQELEVQKNDMLARFDAMKAELENQQIENTARNQEIVNLNENLHLEVEKSEGFLVEGKQLEAQANGVVKQLEGENERLRVEIVELTEAKRVSLEDKDMAANESQMNSGVIEDLEEKLRTAEELLKASDDRLCESTKQTGHCDRNELLSRIEDANIQIDQIQSESDTQITVLQEQLADSKIELEKAENAIKSAVQERDTNTDLTEAVTRRYETVIEENRVKIEELEATIVENTESFEKLINSHSELETDNEQVNSVLQNYIRQFDEQKLVLNELSSKYDQLETETGEKSVVISDLEVQFEKLDSLKISLETMLDEALIENQHLVDQLVVLPGLANEVDEMKQRNVLLEEKSEKERNLLEHAEKELEGLKNEGSDQNEYLVQLKSENEEQNAVILEKSGEIDALSSKLEATQDKLEKDAEYRDEEAKKLTAKFEAKTGIFNNLIQSLKTEVAESDKRAAKLNQELETLDETHKNKISELTTFNEKLDVEIRAGISEKSKIDEENGHLKNQIQGIQVQLKSVETDRANVTQQHAELSNFLEGAKNEILRLTELNAELDTRINEANASLTDRNSKVSLFETENFEISEKLAMVETVLAEKELESQNLNTEKVMVTVKLGELETKFAELCKKSETDENKIRTVVEELQKAKTLSEENIRARTNMESELSNLQLSHDSVADQLQAVMCVEENNGKLSETIEELREEISQQLNTITGLKDSVLDLNTKLTVSEEQLEKVTIDFTETDSKAKTDSCKLTAANEEIQDLTGLRAELEMTLNELKTQLKNNEERTETVLIEKSELEKQMKELNDQNTHFAKNHAQKSSELAKTEQNFISLSRESSDKDEKINGLRALVEDLKQSLIKSDTTISGLTDNLDDVTMKVVKKDSDVGCLEAKLVELENDNQSMKKNLEKTGQELVVKTEISEKLEKSVETLKNTLQVLRQDYEEADRTRKMTDTVQKSAEISTKENDRLNSVIEQQNLAIEALRCKEKEFTLLTKKSDELKSELETLETVTSQQKLEIRALKSDQLRYHEIETKFNEKIEGTREELETRLKQQTALYGNLRAEMDMEMKFRYESDGQVCELEKVKRKLESEVSEQGGNIENMKSTIDGYCKKVDELESSLKTAENELNEAKYANAVQSNLELKNVNSAKNTQDSTSKNKPVDEICKNMKALASPSSAKYEYSQVEKECKRLKIRNERLTTTVTETNTKNRQYQEKLKKYYTLCQQNGLIPGKVVKKKQENLNSTSSVKTVVEASRPTTRTFGGENSVNSQE